MQWLSDATQGVPDGRMCRSEVVRLYQSMRELLESARSAAQDYERCERQLIALRLKAESLGGSNVAATHGPGAHDGLERRVVTLADMGRELGARMARDEQVMDLACDVLFGSDRDHDEHGGLAALVGCDEDGEDRFWAVTALWWHYLQSMPWDEVAGMLHYSVAHVKREAYAAMDIADGYGLAAVIAGRGIAEDDTR